MSAQEVAQKAGLSNAEGTGLLDGVVFDESHFDRASGKLNEAGDKIVDAWVAAKTGASKEATEAREKADVNANEVIDKTSDKFKELREACRKHAEDLFKNRKGEEEKTQGYFEWAGEKIGSSIHWAKASVVGDGGASAEAKKE